MTKEFCGFNLYQISRIVRFFFKKWDFDKKGSLANCWVLGGGECDIFSKKKYIAREMVCQNYQGML